MPQQIVSGAPEHSLRPMTQALVGALELALQEIKALRGESGQWVDELESALLSKAEGFPDQDRDAEQVAQSAIRACVRLIR